MRPAGSCSSSHAFLVLDWFFVTNCSSFLQTGLLRGEVPVLPPGEADDGCAQTLQRTGDFTAASGLEASCWRSC